MGLLRSLAAVIDILIAGAVSTHPGTADSAGVAWWLDMRTATTTPFSVAIWVEDGHEAAGPVGLGPGVPTDALMTTTSTGDAECRIDELKNGCFCDRMSCSSLAANQFG